MTGIIILWYGSITNIPLGWQVCNGTNGTPDLKNKFLVGAGDDYDVDDSGGRLRYAHDFTGSGHLHVMQGGAIVQGGFATQDKTDFRGIAGTTYYVDTSPPFYSLVWIQKMGA